MERTSEPMPVQLDAVGVYVFESRHAANFTMASRRWPFHKIGVVEAGEGMLASDGEQPEEIQAGDVLFIPAGLTHRFEDTPGKPLTLMMVCFDDGAIPAGPGRLFFDAFGRIFPVARPVSLHDAYRSAGVMNALRMMIYEQSQPERTGNQAMIVAQMLQLLVFLTRSFEQHQATAHESATSRSFAASVKLLEEEFHRAVTIQELAAVANLSYRSYTAKFKQHTGRTVKQYQTELRIAYAKQRMRESGNILHAAYQAGFGDLGHFYRVFKRLEGVAPREHLRRLEGR